MRNFICMAFVCLMAGCAHTRQSQTWQSALAQMPLAENVKELNRSNCVNLMLKSFQSNSTVKVMVFMPGATDEFYFFHRAKASLKKSNPTLLDAVTALTRQTRIRVDFFPPFLLLHSPEDPLDIEMEIGDPPTVERLRNSLFLPPHLLILDQDYDHLLPMMEDKLNVKMSPPINSYDSFHFYRHSFAAWNITQWQALEAMALAGKTTVGIGTNQLVFDGDPRWIAMPKTEPK